MNWLTIGTLCILILILIAVVWLIVNVRSRSSGNTDQAVLEEKLRSESHRLAEAKDQTQEKEQEAQRLRDENASMQKTTTELQTRIEERNAQLDTLRQEIAKKDEELLLGTQTIETIKLDLQDTKTRLEEERKQAAEKLALLLEAKEQLKTDFQNLAQQIMDENTKKFSNKNKENMDTLLVPLKEQIGNFRKRIDDVHEKETQRFGEMMGELNRLKELNLQINKDAINLTNALRGQSKVQGNWGEMILERVLEMSGLTKGREYESQVALKDEAGKRYLPDVIIRLPDEKDIVVDSKVSLIGYERYCATDDHESRETALKEHLKSLYQHIDDLSRKEYEKLEGIRSLDYVLMFVPIEAALICALKEDTSIFEVALKKKIMLVSPTNLLFTLKIIGSMWQQENQNRNAQEIAHKAGALYDQFVNFAASLEDVGKQLDKAKEHYETAHKRLHTGRGNLVKRAQDLQSLGIKTKKQLPQHLVDSAENQLLVFPSQKSSDE